MDLSMLNRTPDQITKDILSRLTGLDTRPSSANYQSAGAIAFELRYMALMIEWMKNQTFLATATDGYLDTLAEQFKFKRDEAKPVVVKAEIIGDTVPIGNRFASLGLSDSIIYKIVEYKGDNVYYLQAEELNPQANYYTGDITIIDFIANLTSAKITEIIIPQREVESDEAFRKRIQENLIAEATDGNIAQYKKWLSEIDGVGKSKITSLWNGANTVKCTILNELNQKASEELVEQVQKVLDPDSQGLGEGKAPIGAIVTVDTAEELKINIDITVEYKEGKTSAPTLEQELKDFFSRIAFERTAVSYLQVTGIISNNNDIDYIVSATINGGREDIPVNSNQVPVLGDLDVN